MIRLMRSLSALCALAVALAGCREPPPPPALPPPVSLVDALERALPGLPSPAARVQVLLGLAEGEAAKEPAQAAARLTAAAVALQDAPPDAQAGLRTRLVALWCGVGQVAEARRIADQIPDRELKAETQVYLTEALVAAGRLAEAEQVARAIRVPTHEARARLAVVRGLLAVGERAAAGQKVASMGGLDTRDEALAEVAVAYGRAGHAPEVTAALNDIRSPHWRGVAQVALAEALWRSRVRARAVTEVEQIESLWLRARGFMHLYVLSPGGPGRGLLARALSAAEDISDPLMRSSARADLALELVEAGQVAEGEALLARVEDPSTRHQAEARLAKLHADAGRFDAAEAAVGRVQGDALWIGVANRDLALARARAGEAEAALRTVGRILDPDARWPALGLVAAVAPGAPDEGVLAALHAVLVGQGS